MAGAYQTGIYRNVLKECGYEETAITERLEQTFETIFYGTEAERFYHEAGDDMAYLEDTGNHDVRTEGMSYGMMVCVQLDRKEEFDRLWKWARTYMYLEGGSGHNYFAWSCAVDGSKNAEGPAPDGEEFFAMALFFASNRWGDGDGIFAYSKEARAILSECIHKGEEGHPGEPMWNPDLHLIKFITNVEFTDPSYHLPHFYELFALWADEKDRTFWKKAAEASRDYLHLACHEKTGLCAEYADYDGKPHEGDFLRGKMVNSSCGIWNRHGTIKAEKTIFVFPVKDIRRQIGSCFIGRCQPYEMSILQRRNARWKHFSRPICPEMGSGRPG